MGIQHDTDPCRRARVDGRVSVGSAGEFIVKEARAASAAEPDVVEAAEQVLPRRLVVVAVAADREGRPPVGGDRQHGQVSAPSAVMVQGSVLQEVDTGPVSGGMRVAGGRDGPVSDGFE